MRSAFAMNDSASLKRARPEPSLPSDGDAPRAKRASRPAGASYTVEVQRVLIKKKKTTYLVRPSATIPRQAKQLQECFSLSPPAGYAYLPVGFRHVKQLCRDECLRLGKLYYVVSVRALPSEKRR